MNFDRDSSVFKGAYAICNIFGTELPLEYSGARREYLACRETAWLGVALNCTPIYDISGPDAAKLFNRVCVNKDFSVMKPGTSKHALICNSKGQLIADGVVMSREDGSYRTYWLAPALQYFVMTSDLEVKGEYCSDEYFYQIDGPKSLEILEKATQTDLHDIKFAQNKKVKICGTDMVVHRLGMSGCLAYEVHGAAEDAEIAYTKLREVVEEFGGKPQGFRNYVVMNHTPAGYPNQFQHFAYAYYNDDPGFAEFAKQYGFPQEISGSAAGDREAYHVTPYDIGWGYLVNFDHDFIGKEALMKAKAKQARKAVTLEWNAEDVADIYASQLKGTGIEPYDPIEAYHASYNPGCENCIRGDYVIAGGKKIGLATGRTYAFYERRMISLAFIEAEYAAEGTEVVVMWGQPGHPQKEIRAKIAQFPYYNGEYRNETFDTENIPHPVFDR